MKFIHILRGIAVIGWLSLFRTAELMAQADNYVRIPSDEQHRKTCNRLIISAVVFAVVTGYTIYKVIQTNKKKP